VGRSFVANDTGGNWEAEANFLKIDVARTFRVRTKERGNLSQFNFYHLFK
jgi:hypothetical protein